MRIVGHSCLPLRSGGSTREAGEGGMAGARPLRRAAHVTSPVRTGEDNPMLL